MVYLKGFYEGKLIIGEFAGQYVSPIMRFSEAESKGL